MVRGNAIPSIGNYSAAEKLWTSRTPWRGGDTDERPLKMDRKKHLAIVRHYRHATGYSFAVRYHNTEVVTFYADGSLELRSWKSASTDQVCNAVLPIGVMTWFNHPRYELVGVMDPGTGGRAGWRNDMRWYQAPNVIYLKPAGEFLGRYAVDLERTKLEPFDTYKVNRKRLNAATKESRLGDFKLWYRAAKALSGGLEHKSGYHRLNDFDYLQMLRDPSRWPKIVETTRSEVHMEKTLKHALYSAFNVLDKGEMPSATTTELESLARADRAYSYL